MSVCLYLFEWLYVLSLSSPYLLVFVGDCVICYTGANDVVGGSSEA